MQLSRASRASLSSSSAACRLGGFQRFKFADLTYGLKGSQDAWPSGSGGFNVLSSAGALRAVVKGRLSPPERSLKPRFDESVVFLDPCSRRDPLLVEGRIGRVWIGDPGKGERESEHEAGSEAP